jgi:hypothetical protein
MERVTLIRLFGNGARYGNPELQKHRREIAFRPTAQAQGFLT